MISGLAGRAMNLGKSVGQAVVPGVKEETSLDVEPTACLFESSRKKAYGDRGVRPLLERYTKAAGLAHPVSPHRLRHLLLTWLKKQGIDDALIQPSSGHASRQSLEIYSRLALGDAQTAYADAMVRSPCRRTNHRASFAAGDTNLITGLVGPVTNTLEQCRPHAPGRAPT